MLVNSIDTYHLVLLCLSRRFLLLSRCSGVLVGWRAGITAAPVTERAVGAGDNGAAAGAGVHADGAIDDLEMDLLRAHLVQVAGRRGASGGLRRVCGNERCSQWDVNVNVECCITCGCLVQDCGS